MNNNDINISEKKYSTLSVVSSASAGTIIEWYDFLIFGALSVVLSTKFFPSADSTASFLSTVATFAAGLIVRPFGAIVFGRIGDMIGRKYTFMLTLLLMGGSTFLIGCVPTYHTIGVFAPIIILILRLIQGLALGGEYGGAATYVGEHSPPNKRGLWMSWIQNTGVVGMILSLIVIALIKLLLGKESFDEYGWRVPFLLSAFLVFISYRIRRKMDESPVFLKLKYEGKISQNPLKESFGKVYNLKYVLLALLGLVMGQGVISYTSHLYTLNFFQRVLFMDSFQADVLIICGLGLIMPLNIYIAHLSDKIGRKWIMLGGILLGVLLFVPAYEQIYQLGNLNDRIENYSKSYKNVYESPSDIYTTIHKEFDDETIYEEVVKQSKLTKQIYENKTTVIYGWRTLIKLMGFVFVIMVVLSISNSPSMAYLVEMFPTKIRYTSVSLPHAIGQGVFGGLLPFVSAFLMNDAQLKGYDYWYLYGLLYPMSVMIVCFIIGAIYLRK